MKKYNQKIDSVFVGDSYTWGSCVKDNQTIQAVFDRFNNSNSLNLGNIWEWTISGFGLIERIWYFFFT